MTENEELAWVRGNRAAWQRILSTCLRELGYGPEHDTAKWASEREAVVVALRGICERHGDNDWGENLHLADVIEKHLERYMPDVRRCKRAVCPTCGLDRSLNDDGTFRYHKPCCARGVTPADRQSRV